MNRGESPRRRDEGDEADLQFDGERVALVGGDGPDHQRSTPALARIVDTCHAPWYARTVAATSIPPGRVARALPFPDPANRYAPGRRRFGRRQEATFALRRREDLSTGEFRTYWEEELAPVDPGIPREGRTNINIIVHYLYYRPPVSDDHWQMTRYTDTSNTGVPTVPVKTESSTSEATNRELLEETVFSHRLE